MKALVYHGNRDIRYQDFPEPPLLHREVRLRVKSSGLCHTDFSEYMYGPLHVAATPHHRTGRSVPLVIGHEFSGEVVETAPGVTKLQTGDRVAVNVVDCCGNCEFCRRGLLLHCPSVAAVGFERDGGFAEYAVVPEGCCHVLRPSVSFPAGALVEPLSVAMHSMFRSKVEAGSRAAVIGGGTIGLCTLQTLRACGVMDVYVIEKNQSKQPFADAFGATEFIHTERFDPRQVIMGRTGGMGVDFAFECAGSASALQTALSVTRPGGTVCLSGVIPRPIEFDWYEVLAREKAIVTTNAYGDEYPLVIAMLNDGRLKAEPLITRTFDLKSALGFLTRFEEAGKDDIKMQIDMDS